MLNMRTVEQKIITNLLGKAMEYALEPGKNGKWLEGYAQGVKDAANILEEVLTKHND